MSVALVTVVSGERYEAFAKDMFASAFEFFGPDPVVAHIALPGRPGWPDATLYRYHVLMENEHVFHGFDYTYLIDADMRFEAPVGPEILDVLVATQHPGFVTRPASSLPYERNPASRAYVPPGAGKRYYAGGFVGGMSAAFFNFAMVMRDCIEYDDEDGVVAEWHDESHLNSILDCGPPSLVLSPSYCMPNDASGYPWLKGIERKIVALDKTPAERGKR